MTGENIESVFHNLGAALLKEFETDNISEIKKEAHRASVSLNVTNHTVKEKKVKTNKTCKC